MGDDMLMVATAAFFAGAGTKIGEVVVESAPKWIRGRFLGHRDAVIAAAVKNSEGMLAALADRVRKVEHDNAAIQQAIEAALDRPDVSASFQLATLTAAQTDDPEKHRLLARILADRLVAGEATMTAAVTNLAMEAIGKLTPNQIRLTGLGIALQTLRPEKEETPEALSRRLEFLLAPFVSATAGGLDILHLDSLSVFRMMLVGQGNLEGFLKGILRESFDPSFVKSSIGERIDLTWSRGLTRTHPLPAGMLIGTHVVELLVGTAPLDLSKGWSS